MFRGSKDIVSSGNEDDSSDVIDIAGSGNASVEMVRGGYSIDVIGDTVF